MDPKELAGRIFVTCYMGTENSSEETRKRASDLAEEIGSYHMGTFFIVVFLIILIVDGSFFKNNFTQLE